MIKKILFLLLFPSILFAQYGHGIVWKSISGNIYYNNGNVGIGTTSPDSATLQIASGIGVHDFYIGDATTWSRIDAGGGVVTSSDSTKKRNIVRVDSLIKVKNLFQKVLATGIYQWQWNPDSIFVKFDSSFVTGWDTLTVLERDSIRQSYIVKETKRVNNVVRFKHYSPLAQEFGSIWLNKPNNKKLDWQLIAVINWYTNQQIIKEIMAIKQKIGL